MTLEGRKVMKEGWLTLFKSRKTGIFNSKPAVREGGREGGRVKGGRVGGWVGEGERG